MSKTFDLPNEKMPVSPIGKPFGILRLSVVFLCFFLLPIFMGAQARAGFNDGLEKPRPKFSREGDTITATLIPRAKSTSIRIKFTVEGARLDRVEGVDFATVDTPEVDVKNFKSEVFRIFIDNVPAKGSVLLVASSSFFASGTEFFVFNEHLKTPWVKSAAESTAKPERVYDLGIRVEDGGQLDSDGVANGKIVLVGGPRDSFWGYAMGTLFIRFFGIFLVLCLLMIGMIVSGKVFSDLERRKEAEIEENARLDEAASKAAATKEGEKIDPEMAAAITVALNLHLSEEPTPFQVALDSPQLASWCHQGRCQLMDCRVAAFSRQRHL